MQSTVDGDVRLSVGLDTKAAENDLKNISNDVKKILQALESQSDKLSSKFDTLNNSVSSIATTLTDLQRHFASITSISLPVEQLSRLAAGITGINTEVAATRQNVTKANEGAIKFSNTVAKIGQTTINLGAEDLQSQFEKAKEEYLDLQKRLNEKTTSKELSAAQMNELSSSVDIAREKYSRLERAVSILQTTMTQFDNSSGSVSSKILRLQTNVNKAENAVIQLEQKLALLQTTQIPTEKYAELSQKMKDLEQLRLQGINLKRLPEYAVIKREVENLLKSGKAFKDITQTTGYKNLLNQLQIANSKLEEAKQKLEERRQAESEDTNAINQNTAAVERNAQARRNATAVPSTAAPDTKQQEIRLLRIANIAGTVTSRLSGFTSALSKFFGRISSFITKSSKDTDKGFKNINKSINRGIVNLLKYTLGIRSIYILFNKLRRAGIDSFKSLVKQSEPLNKTISETYSAFINLKNAIGPAFQPLVSVVAPILTRFADSLTSVTYKLGEFFAALTGQSYIYKAIKAQKDYAKSLDKTSDKLKDNLASFDKLNVLPDKNKDTDEDKVQYEITPISDTFSTLKSLIDAQDWEGIGQRIAERINIGLEAVKKALSWDNIGGTVTGFVLAFTGIFNSLVANINWDLLGQTVGEGVNTIVNTLNLLLTGIDWVNLGASLATGLNSMITTVNWTNVGRLLGNWFMKSWNIFFGFVKNLDFSKIGKAIADGINGFFDTFNFSTVTSSIATFVNGLSTTLLNIVSETDWGQPVDNIASGINNALFETDWGQLAAGLSKSLTTTLNTVIDTAANIDWQKVGYSLVEFLINIDWGGLVKNLFKAIGTAIGGIAGIIKGIWDNLTKVQEDFWNEQFSETGGNIALGILNGVIDIWKGIGTWIRDNVFRPFAEGIWKAFGAWDFEQSVEKWLEENVWRPVFDLFNNVWSWVTGLADKFKNAFIKVVEAIKQPFKNIADWFKNTFSKAWEAVKNVFSTGGKIFEGIKEGIYSVFKTVVNGIIDGINNVVAVPFNAINAALNGIRDFDFLGAKPFEWINPITVPQIPKLAQGTVVPANFGSFLAELGDNKREPEIVSPVSKIEEAVENVLRRTGGFLGGGDGKLEVNLNVDGRTLYSVIVRQDEIERKRHGGRSRLGTVTR